VTVTPLVDSNIALTVAALFGIINVAVVAVGLLIVTPWPPDVNSHRTNLYPLAGFAVRVMFEPCLAFVVKFEVAVPHELLFLVTVKARVAVDSKRAVTVTAAAGIVNDAVRVVLLFMLLFVIPETATHSTKVYPLGAVAVKFT